MIMLLITHILIALGSIVYSGYACWTPSKNKLRISYSLIALTLASGTYLVISTHAPLTQACLSGLIYLAVATGLLVIAHSKLAREDKII